uniref:Spondin domain-containing protein n=1 Tax=Macrostomum lignano TaxID=282301 RepID=A0A1I8H671_9PLAT
SSRRLPQLPEMHFSGIWLVGNLRLSPGETVDGSGVGFGPVLHLLLTLTWTEARPSPEMGGGCCTCGAAVEHLIAGDSAQLAIRQRLWKAEQLSRPPSGWRRLCGKTGSAFWQSQQHCVCCCTVGSSAGSCTGSAGRVSLSSDSRRETTEATSDVALVTTEPLDSLSAVYTGLALPGCTVNSTGDRTIAESPPLLQLSELLVRRQTRWLVGGNEELDQLPSPKADSSLPTRRCSETPSCKIFYNPRIFRLLNAKFQNMFTLTGRACKARLTMRTSGALYTLFYRFFLIILHQRGAGRYGIGAIGVLRFTRLDLQEHHGNADVESAVPTVDPASMLTLKTGPAIRWLFIAATACIVAGFGAALDSCRNLSRPAAAAAAVAPVKPLRIRLFPAQGATDSDELNAMLLGGHYQPDGDYVIAVLAESGAKLRAYTVGIRPHRTVGRDVGRLLAREPLTDVPDADCVSFTCAADCWRRGRRQRNQLEFDWTAPSAASSDTAECVELRALAELETDGAGRAGWWVRDSRVLCRAPVLGDPALLRLPAAECCACGSANYRLQFQSLALPWRLLPSARTAARLAWSQLLGVTHDRSYTIWQAGGFASPGLRALTESGLVGQLESEIRQLSRSGVLTVIKAKDVPPWTPLDQHSRSAILTVNTSHHLVTLLSRLAPSQPGAFVGASLLDLCLANCSWSEGLRLPLTVWDAGTIGREPLRRIRPQKLAGPVPDGRLMRGGPLAMLWLHRIPPVSGTPNDGSCS